MVIRHGLVLAVLHAVEILSLERGVQGTWLQSAVGTRNARLNTPSHDGCHMDAVLWSEILEGSEVFQIENEPEWSQLHAKSITERVQCCFGCIVDRTEHIRDNLGLLALHLGAFDS